MSNSEKYHQISVIINTKNRKNDLKKCLNAIFNGTYKNFEVIVVDNNSVDGTIELLKRYPVKVVSSDSKKLSHLFNIGWKNADSEFLAYIADDVQVHKDWLKWVVKLLSSDPKVGAVGGPIISMQKQEMHYLYEKANKNNFSKIFFKIIENIVFENKLFEPGVLCDSGAYSMGAGLDVVLRIKKPREVDLLTTSSMGVKKSVLKELGGFDESFYFNHSDGDLFVRMKKRGYKLIFHPQIISWHYVRGGPSRNPYMMGRDTALFHLKDIRPKTLKGVLGFVLNIFIFNSYWLYKAISEKDITLLKGILGYFLGCVYYIINFLN